MVDTTAVSKFCGMLVLVVDGDEDGDGDGDGYRASEVRRAYFTTCSCFRSSNV